MSSAGDAAGDAEPQRRAPTPSPSSAPSPSRVPSELFRGVPDLRHQERRREHRAPTQPHHRRWCSRGYLPHCDHPGLLQVMTYRLAGGLPAMVLAQMGAELHSLPVERQTAERRKRIEAWLGAGYGSCVPGLPEAAACVVDTWRHFAGER